MRKRWPSLTNDFNIVKCPLVYLIQILSEFERVVRIDGSIANSESLEVYLEVCRQVLVVNFLANGRHVFTYNLIEWARNLKESTSSEFTSIGLPECEEVVLLVLLKDGEPLSEELVEVFPHVILIDGKVVGGVTEAGPDRLVDVEDIGHFGPGVGVEPGGSGGSVLGVDSAEGAVDLEQSEHGRGAGAAL